MPPSCLLHLVYSPFEEGFLSNIPPTLFERQCLGTAGVQLAAILNSVLGGAQTNTKYELPQGSRSDGPIAIGSLV